MATSSPTTDLPIGMLDTVTAAADWVIVLPVALALMGSAGLLMFRRSNGTPLIGALIVVCGIIACEVALLLQVLANGPVSMTMGKWLPPFGISLTADAFGATFALAAAIVTLIVLLYAELDRAEADGRDAFHSMVLLLLAGVTGAFLTGDLFNLYVWFEVMLIASFGLIVQGNRPMQLDGAIKYGFLNFLATTFFLLALGLLYGLLGTLNMSDIMRVAPAANPAAMAGVAALLMLAFGMKAAAFPVNAWLPASYHTPTAAVSALFAGLLTKVGAYAMLRALVAVLPASRELLEPALGLLAIATLVIAPLGAIAETNLRRAIGFVVIGGIGAVMAGLAIPSLNGIAGSGLYIFHAILTMTALYMVAGLVEKRTGAADTRQMGGLYAASAPISILFLVLVLAAAGVPPFLGFWPKLLLLEAGLAEGVTGAAPTWLGTAMVFALMINAVLTLIAGSRLWAHVFWRSGPEGEGAEHASTSLVALDGRGRLAFGATAVLVVGIVTIGLWPGPLMDGIRAGAADIADPARYVAATGLAGDAQ
ncbi:Na+/H+ antiporter subunit D [Devosia sp. XJ19-1]|uniref:Na+/H+ antiporter subunit D n=1 Tax=Devosia ureilytica TaxID=2952754 RepID=A0A9Q4AQN1_9HYPH|nr:proton-conducting transporter membrane subunit [Devosia ureilytica]MCP8884290.1 Na+/H+ antiporter subunit D [Devosia ureilytica]MCP8887898.1 Na+/H+ antiporter subunit D [Devosia ureilytica]